MIQLGKKIKKTIFTTFAKTKKLDSHKEMLQVINRNKMYQRLNLKKIEINFWLVKIIAFFFKKQFLDLN